MQAVSGEAVNEAHRSGCPINLSLEVFGDKWSLLILRDMIFGGRRHFRELLSGSQEGIASNILAHRLKSLVEMGMLSKRDDTTHKQKVIYSLTDPAIELVPVMAQLGAWGSRWRPSVRRCGARVPHPPVLPADAQADAGHDARGAAAGHVVRTHGVEAPGCDRGSAARRWTTRGRTGRHRAGGHDGGTARHPGHARLDRRRRRPGGGAPAGRRGHR